MRKFWSCSLLCFAIHARAYADISLEKQTFEALWANLESTCKPPLNPTEAMDKTLADIAKLTGPWMLTARALECALQISSDKSMPQLKAVAHTLLRHEATRVRALAVLFLGTALSDDTRQLLFTQDPWPRVRAATVLVKGNNPQLTHDLRIQALRDRSPVVRRAAIEGLIIARDLKAWPEIQAILVLPSQHPDVIEMGVLFATSQCPEGARSWLDATRNDTKASEVLRAGTQRALGRIEDGCEVKPIQFEYEDWVRGL